MSDFVTKDSGERARFASGMQRDTEKGKARFDLLHPLGVPYDDQFLTRVAKLMGRGAEKYEDRNWEKADSEAELARMRSSAARHFEQWLTGETDEDHAAAVVFNLLAHETIRYKLDASNTLEVLADDDGDAPEAFHDEPDEPKFAPFDHVDIQPFSEEIRRIVELYPGPVSTEAKLAAAGRDLAERLAEKRPRFETDAFELLLNEESPHQKLAAAIRESLRKQALAHESYSIPRVFMAGDGVDDVAIGWRDPAPVTLEATDVSRTALRLVTGQPRFTVDSSGEVADFDVDYYRPHSLAPILDCPMAEPSTTIYITNAYDPETNGVQRSFDRR